MVNRHESRNERQLSKTRHAKRVVRGGAWNNQAKNCRAAIRNRNEPGNRRHNLGLRLAAAHPPRRSRAADPVFVVPRFGRGSNPASGDW